MIDQEIEQILMSALKRGPLTARGLALVAKKIIPQASEAQLLRTIDYLIKRGYVTLAINKPDVILP